MSSPTTMRDGAPSRPAPRGPRSKTNSGFTVVEVLLAMTVFAIGIGAVSSTLVATRSLSSTTRETRTAVDAATSMLETLKGEGLTEVFVRYNATDADDPSADAPGNLFGVEALRLVTGDEDGFVGEIIFPGDGIELREDVVDAELGMPRDLNGDGAVDVDDHSGDYVVLPVRVRLEWSGQNGRSSVEFVTLLTDL